MMMHCVAKNKKEEESPSIECIKALTEIFGFVVCRCVCFFFSLVSLLNTEIKFVHELERTRYTINYYDVLLLLWFWLWLWLRLPCRPPIEQNEKCASDTLSIT